MQLAQRGFTLLETLIAMALSSMVLLGAGKLFPTLQRGVLLQYQKENTQESIWQVAFGIGKHLRRAGYCHGQCDGEGLSIAQSGECVIARWDTNSNGRWEAPGHAEAESTGFRLRSGSIETLKGAANCTGSGWERITDPQLVAIKSFRVSRKARQALPVLLEIHLESLPVGGTKPISLRHSVVGYNL